MVNLGCISHWNDGSFKNEGFKNVNKKLKDETKAYQGELDTYRMAMRKARLWYIEGNHEDWVRGYAEKYSQPEEINIRSLLNLKQKKITFIPRGAYVKEGRIYFCHGDQWGSTNPSKQAVERGGNTVVMGHWHTYKVWSHYSAIETKRKFVGVCSPCYSSLAPSYLRGRSTNWMNGFFWACIKKSGNFSFGVVLVSPKGHFVTSQGVEYT